MEDLELMTRQLLDSFGFMRNSKEFTKESKRFIECNTLLLVTLKLSKQAPYKEPMMTLGDINAFKEWLRFCRKFEEARDAWWKARNSSNKLRAVFRMIQLITE